MAFRQKAKFILKYNPDILIIQECEHPYKLKFNSDFPEPEDILWYGKNENKGLAIFSYSDYRFKLLDSYNPDFKLVIPIEVTGNDLNFILYAIWAYNPDDKNNQYIGQVWKAINYYDKILKNNHSIIIGDFNSNVIWDKLKRIGNHSHVVQYLEGIGVQSTYHKMYNQLQGKEQHPTFYMYKQESKPYHIDYCFVSKLFLNNVQNVKIGEYENYIRYSDHMPIIIEFII
jgi:exodeoxyribonuclease III